MLANFSILLQQETFLLDAMFEVPSQPDIAEVVIDEDVIKGKKGPQYIRKKKEQEAPAASGDTEKVGVVNSATV